MATASGRARRHALDWRMPLARHAIRRLSFRRTLLRGPRDRNFRFRGSGNAGQWRAACLPARGEVAQADAASVR